MANLTYNQQTSISAVYFNPANEDFVRLSLVFIQMNNEETDPNKAIVGLIEFKGDLHPATKVEHFLGYFNEEEEFSKEYWMSVAIDKLHIKPKKLLVAKDKTAIVKTNILPFRLKTATING